MLRPNHAAVTALLTALVALGPMSTDLYLPSLPALTAYFGVGEAAGQLTLSAFLLGLAGGQIIYGPLSDRYGRRPVLLFGIGLYAAASIVCAAASSIEALVIARFCQACGACVGPVLGRAVVRDVYGREGAARIMSYMSAAIALAPAIGPIIGGFVETWFGWRANFVVLLLYGAAALALTFLLLPETNTHRDTGRMSPARIARAYISFFGERAYFGYVFTVAFGYCGIFAFISASSFILVDSAGLSPGLYGFCFAAVVLGYIAGTLISGRLSARLGIDRLIAIGSLVGFAGALLVLILALLKSGAHGNPGGDCCGRADDAVPGRRRAHDAERRRRRDRALSPRGGDGIGPDGFPADGAGGHSRRAGRPFPQRHGDSHGRCPGGGDGGHSSEFLRPGAAVPDGRHRINLLVLRIALLFGGL